MDCTGGGKVQGMCARKLKSWTLSFFLSTEREREREGERCGCGVTCAWSSGNTSLSASPDKISNAKVWNITAKKTEPGARREEKRLNPNQPPIHMTYRERKIERDIDVSLSLSAAVTFGCTMLMFIS